MLDSYRRVFAHRGAAAFSATGLVARLPIAMMTLGIVLLVSALRDSYALAGQVSAAYVVGNAVFAVPHGRLADRFGQHRVLVVDAVAFAATTLLMIEAIARGWSTPWPHAYAALAGAAVPQVGAMVRSRWSHLLDVEEERNTAFAVEGVADEVVFVTGPTLVTFLATAYAPQSGLLTAMAIGTVGAVVLAAQRRTEPPAHPPDPAVGRAAMPWAVLLPVTLAALGLGSLFGALEVATVAVAEDHGHKGVAGVMLAAFALGSLVAGVVAGALTWRTGPLRRARIGLVLLAGGTLLLPLVPGLPLVTVALFLTGLTLAPTLVALFSLLGAAIPGPRLNEAMGFLQTGMGAGLAPGAWLAGVVADAHGGAAAYAVCGGSAVVAALAGLVVRAAPAQPVPKPASDQQEHEQQTHPTGG